MATTNTNTSKDPLSTDIYDVSSFLDQVRADTIPDLDDTSSMIGIFGYMNEMFSQSLQNTLIVTAESSNEAIPTRAKFTRNVINHAMNLSITDIYAKPAAMTMMVYLPIEYIERNFVEQNKLSGRGKFILDKNCPIFVGEYEFHFDYDVIITKIRNPQGNFVYTAIYDLFESGTTIVRQENSISDITNPYITTVVQTTINDVNYLGFSARLHQVTLNTVEKTVLTDNSIENKTITFEFDDQLAAFDIDVTENGVVKHLFPVYEGLLTNSLEDGEWCYYEFLDEHTIRILFSRDSYVPGLNAVVTVNIKSCEGASGNFTYVDPFRISLQSEKYNNYNGMYALFYPLLNGVSNGGKDCKSIKDLKKIIPREASSRGAIINTTDLQNFFNSIDNTTCRVYFKKKRDNQFERMYYAYMIMRKNGNVYPTNTLPLKLNQVNFKGFAGNNNLVISPGTKFYYYNHGSDIDNAYATVIPPTFVEGLDKEDYPYPMTINADGDMVRVFEYITPFLISIDDDLISSYFMTVLDDRKTFKFVSINTDADVQFVATNMRLTRNFIYKDENGDQKYYDYKYTMAVDITQNNSSDYKLLKYHIDEATGNKVFDDIRIRMIMVLYADDTDKNPYRYVEAELVDYSSSDIYTFNFNLSTDDFMDLNNRINILGVYNAKPEAFQNKNSLYNSHGYMCKNTYAKIFIMADFGTKAGDIVNGIVTTKETEKIALFPEDTGNRTEIEGIIPVRQDLVEAFLNNDIRIYKNGELYNVVAIMKRNDQYMEEVYNYNKDDQKTELAILRYLRNNKDSYFVQNVLLKDESVNEVIDSYNYEDFSRYTVCNVMSVDDGITFYHDYSNMMRSDITIKQIQKTDNNGNPVFAEIRRTDEFGKEYTELKPVYLTNNSNTYQYMYTVDRVPMIKEGYLNTDELVQDYIYDLEERRKYITECLYVLEDTFDIDLKFFNTYGPSQMFYYDIPNTQNYFAKATVDGLEILSDTSYEDGEDKSNVVTSIPYGTRLHITKIRGQWGYTTEPEEGWVKLADTSKMIHYIDNTALTFKWALEAESSADKFISNNIITDIKEFIEDINEINELHIPNIITLITNNYREQIIYFEFLDVNGYGSACQHLYYDEKISADICPEFLNVATKKEESEVPEIDIIVY